MNARTLILGSAVLLGLLACGGKDGDTPKPAGLRMDSAEATTFTASFLDMENGQEDEMDAPVVERIGDALAVPAQPAPRCATATPISTTSVKLEFKDCTGPHGWTWNGVVIVSWQVNNDGTSLTKRESQNMVGTKDGKSWTVNGIKAVLRNKQTMQAHIRTERGFTKVFSDGAKTTTFSYDCNLFADHSVMGQRKLWGDWSLTPQAPATGGASANIDKKTALLWERAANCCHPVAGTLEVKRGDKNATLVFGLPCGSVTVNGEAKTLGACR
jgi:hypothetical protein